MDVHHLFQEQREEPCSWCARRDKVLADMLRVERQTSRRREWGNDEGTDNQARPL